MIASGNLRNAEYTVLNAGRDSSEQAAEPTISGWAAERGQETGRFNGLRSQKSLTTERPNGSLGPGRGRGAATLEYDRLSFGNCCDDIV